MASHAVVFVSYHVAITRAYVNFISAFSRLCVRGYGGVLHRIVHRFFCIVHHRLSVEWVLVDYPLIRSRLEKLTAYGDMLAGSVFR
jgi:hypothetical protein